LRHSDWQTEAKSALRGVEHWLSESDLSGLYTAAYWNDIDEERRKPWWIEDGDYDRCRRYLRESGLLSDYEAAEAFIRELRGGDLRIADLAAGIGWTSALLSKLDAVAEVHCVEISIHRLERLFPHSITMFEGQAPKIHRYLGSFYDLKLAERSVDVVFLSQAFHHADHPVKLLTQCDRVLRPGGRLLIVGEHHIGPWSIIRRFLSMLLRQRRIVTAFRDLFPPDGVLGDHYYRRSDYYLLLGSMGYRVRHRRAPTGDVIYVADKNR
jgi:SAM-dependent methyltransferase